MPEPAPIRQSKTPEQIEEERRREEIVQQQEAALFNVQHPELAAKARADFISKVEALGIFDPRPQATREDRQNKLKDKPCFFRPSATEPGQFVLSIKVPAMDVRVRINAN